MTAVRLVLASDRVAAGERADATAEGVRAILEAAGLELEGVVAVPDDEAALVKALREAVAACPLVLTSGGTGLSVRDVSEFHKSGGSVFCMRLDVPALTR